VLKGASAAPIVVATAIAGALTLSGCQVMSPIQTNATYQPSDGVAVDLGDVQIRDFVVVSGAKGDVGTLSGMVVNNGTKPVTITFAAGADKFVSAVAPANSQTRLSGIEGTNAITLPNIAAAPGGILQVTVSTPAAGGSEVAVPVLLPDGYYATLKPAPPQSQP
jgi:hypothetical protein